MCIILALVFSLICSGCQILSPASSYSVDLSAETGVGVKQFVVTYPGFRGEVQDFEISAGMKYMSICAPIPPTATCSWVDRSGSTQSVVVPISTQLPSVFRSTRDGLIFTVTRDDRIALSVYLREEKYQEKMVPLSVFPEGKR